MIIREPYIVHEDRFTELLNSELNFNEETPVDIWFVCFYAYLKSKINNKGLWQTTTDLIEEVRQEELITQI